MVVQQLKLLTFHFQGVQVRSLVWKLESHMPHGEAKTIKKLKKKKKKSTPEIHTASLLPLFH